MRKKDRVIMKTVYTYISSIRFIFHWIYYKYSKSHDILEKDLARNISLFVLGKGEEKYKSEYVTFYNFCYVLTFYTMVRNIFYTRVKKNNPCFARFLKYLASPQPMLDISPSAEIGGGLIVQHGYCSIIDPKRMGEDCWINQGVNIGYTNETDAPVIGNNVRVSAGACILGDLRVGDNVIVGANAVVTKDVPDNCIVGGVPAKIIKYI